jgi:hypothetical protein
MLQVSVDTKAAHAAVDGMIKKLNHFRRVDIGLELSSWQTQNMHRHRPFTMRSRAKGLATTVIRPHSEFEVRQRERVAKRYERGVRRLLRQLTGKSKRKVRRIPKPIHRTSTRPYLRASLLQILQTRMQNMMRARLTWR